MKVHIPKRLVEVLKVQVLSHNDKHKILIQPGKKPLPKKQDKKLSLKQDKKQFPDEIIKPLEEVKFHKEEIPKLLAEAKCLKEKMKKPRKPLLWAG